MSSTNFRSILIFASCMVGTCSIFFVFLIFCPHSYLPASGQAVVTGVVSSPRRFSPSMFIAHRIQQSHCSSIFHRVLLTHALVPSTCQFVRKKHKLNAFDGDCCSCSGVSYYMRARYTEKRSVFSASHADGRSCWACAVCCTWYLFAMHSRCVRAQKFASNSAAAPPPLLDCRLCWVCVGCYMPLICIPGVCVRAHNITSNSAATATLLTIYFDPTNRA